MPATNDPMSAARVLATRILSTKGIPPDIKNLAKMFDDAFKAMMERQGGFNQLFVSTIIASRTTEPYVVLEFGGQRLQLTLEQATDVGVWIIKAAEGALCESNVMRLLDEKVGLPIEQASRVIADFRNFRMDRERSVSGENPHGG